MYRGKASAHDLSLSLSLLQLAFYISLSLSLFFSPFFTGRALVRLLLLLSQEFLAHSRLFVISSFDLLLTGEEDNFIFSSLLGGEAGLIFEGTIGEYVTFPFSSPSFYFPHHFRSIEEPYGG